MTDLTELLLVPAPPGGAEAIGTHDVDGRLPPLSLSVPSRVLSPLGQAVISFKVTPQSIRTHRRCAQRETL